MEYYERLNDLKERYAKGENIIAYLKGLPNQDPNVLEAIKISYDLQAGSYIKGVKEEPDVFARFDSTLAGLIDRLDQFDSILEVGVGEATTLAQVTKKLANPVKSVYGFDISWSRLKFAQQYLAECQIKTPSTLFLADLFQIPIQDDSIDLVYTSHSIEPNGGREREALQELYRITGKYLILLEPSWEFASQEGRERMARHGYVRNLYETAKSLGFDIVEHRLFDVIVTPLNPTGLLVIKKRENKLREKRDIPFACPITKRKLELQRSCYYSKEGMLAYPIIDGIPCLVKNNAVVATHFAEF